MINALHLLWIIPVSFLFGFILCSFFVMSKESDKQSEDIIREYERKHSHKS